MNILNMTFSTINAERKSTPKGKISVANNIKIEKIENTNIGVDKTNATMKIDYSFITQYNPDFATITLKGTVIALEEKKKADEILAEWQKTKKLNKEFSLPLLNALMGKCSIEAILMSKELGLPSPVQMPRINAQAAPPATGKKNNNPKK